MLDTVKELVWSALMVAGFVWVCIWVLLGSINFWLSRLVAKSEKLKQLTNKLNID